MKKKNTPLSEVKEFQDLCKRIATLHACCEGGTKRSFVGVSLETDWKEDKDCCIILFRGDADDIFAIRDFLEERDS